ncbi:MAG: hypothetical protein ACYC28_13700 [Longimicrobiales bacterium]
MLRGLTVALLLIAAAGCGSPTEPPQGVTVTAEFSQSVVVPGDTVWVDVTVRNSSNVSVVVHGGGCGFARLELRRATDLEVVPSYNDRACQMIYTPHTVEPGSELRGGDYLAIPADGIAIDPGQYMVRGIAALDRYGVARSAFQPLQVMD